MSNGAAPLCKTETTLNAEIALGFLQHAQICLPD